MANKYDKIIWRNNKKLQASELNEFQNIQGDKFDNAFTAALGTSKGVKKLSITPIINGVTITASLFAYGKFFELSNETVGNLFLSSFNSTVIIYAKISETIINSEQDPDIAIPTTKEETSLRLKYNCTLHSGKTLPLDIVNQPDGVNIKYIPICKADGNSNTNPIIDYETYPISGVELGRDPINPLDPATKQYVDNVVDKVVNENQVIAGTGLEKIGKIMHLKDTTIVPGTYKSVTVDQQGRITSGTNPTTLSGYGITDAANINIVGPLSNLRTSTKSSVVDAINEVFQSGVDAKTSLVDAVNSKGGNVSTNMPWNQIIDGVRNIKVGYSMGDRIPDFKLSNLKYENKDLIPLTQGLFGDRELRGAVTIDNDVIVFSVVDGYDGTNVGYNLCSYRYNTMVWNRPDLDVRAICISQNKQYFYARTPDKIYRLDPRTGANINYISTLGFAGSSGNKFTIDCDNLGNIYCLNDKDQVSKLGPTGTIIWSESPSNSNETIIFSCAPDGSFLYVIRDVSNAFYYQVLVCINMSTGSDYWTKTIKTSFDTRYYNYIKASSSGGVYCTMQKWPEGNQYFMGIYYINTQGTLIWHIPETDFTVIRDFIEVSGVLYFIKTAPVSTQIISVYPTRRARFSYNPEIRGTFSVSDRYGGLGGNYFTVTPDGKLYFGVGSKIQVMSNEAYFNLIG